MHSLMNILLGPQPSLPSPLQVSQQSFECNNYSSLVSVNYAVFRLNCTDNIYLVSIFSDRVVIIA